MTSESGHLVEIMNMKPPARFRGNYQGLIQWVRRVESQYSKKELLPIEEAVIVNQCGYIFQGSTNKIKYIEDEEYKIC